MNLRYVSSFAIGPIISAALGLIILPFLTWFFSVEDIGRYTMAQIVLGLSGTLISLEMHQAYVREYFEYNNKTVLLKTSMQPGIIILFLVVLSTVIFPKEIAKLLFGIDSTILSFLLLTSVICSFILNFLSHVLRMEERGIAFSLTQVTPKLTLIIIIGLIVLLNIPNTFSILLSAYTISLVASLLCFLVVTYTSWKEITKVNVDFGLLRQMLKFSFPLVAGGLAYWGLTTIDRFFLRVYSGFSELGIYSISITVVSAVNVITTVFSSIWHPTVYKWVKEGINAEKVKTVIEFMTIGFSFIWSMAGLISWILPTFLPTEYNGIPFLIVAAISMPLFYLLSETTVIGIGISRKSGYSMFASLAAVIVNVILNYILIPTYGAAGAALATCYSFFIFFVIRTESSAYLWVSIPRIKTYIICSAYLITTTTLFILDQVFNYQNVLYFNLVWISLIILSFVLFSNRIKQLYMYLNDFLSKA